MVEGEAIVGEVMVGEEMVDEKVAAEEVESGEMVGKKVANGSSLVASEDLVADEHFE